jgi:hypothetical protein
MQRPAQHPSGVLAAARHTVAPLLELVVAASQAHHLGRMARAVELRERALALGEAALPHDSLTLALLLNNTATARMEVANDARGTCVGTMHERARLPQSRECALSLRAFDIFDAHWRAGTLFAPSAEDTAYFESILRRDPVTRPAEIFINCAHQALQVWLPGALPAEDKPRLRAMFNAVRAALALDAYNLPWRAPERGLLCNSVLNILRAVLDVDGMDCADATERQLRVQLHAAGALSPAEQAAARALEHRVHAHYQAVIAARGGLNEVATQDAMMAERLRNAAADAARHGLRVCALPECDKLEAHAKQFKLCGRCRGVVYCSPAHQTADWRRHKRDDGCKAAA